MSFMELIRYIGSYIAANSEAATGIAGAVIGYLLKSRVDDWRDKKKRILQRKAEELESLLKLCKGMQAAFASEPNAIYKRTHAFIEKCDHTIIPKTVRSEVKSFNKDLRQILPNFQDPPFPAIMPMTKDEHAAWKKRKQDKAVEKQKSRKQAEEISRKLLNTLQSAYDKII